MTKETKIAIALHAALVAKAYLELMGVENATMANLLFRDAVGKSAELEKVLDKAKEEEK